MLKTHHQPARIAQVMPGTRKLSDLVTDFNATEEACHGELTGGERVVPQRDNVWDTLW